MSFHPNCPAAWNSRGITRREWLSRMGLGFGGLALADMMSSAKASEGGLPGLPHFAPKAKRVIFLFQSGGPSQLDSFDYKPMLEKKRGMELPESLRRGKPLPGMSGNQASFPLIGSPWKFAQHGQSGAWVSEQFPHIAKVVDDLCFIKSMSSEAVNHDPAMCYMQTGAQTPGRPSIGAWVNYGLGTDNHDLPGFIVLITKKGADQPLSSRLWDTGFLPSQYQGVQFRSGRDAVLNLSDPEGMNRADTRRMLDALKELHTQEAAVRHDSRIEARISQYEMAFRMQASVPEATDISKEPEHVFELYGGDSRKPGTFAANCILARRLAERGVKFIQLYNPGWDHHGGLPKNFPLSAVEIDQACAALITDLKQRDLLKDTLVIWGGEFGRTCYSQGSLAAKSATPTFGREHHREAFTFWMAGGGVKPGITYGESDELGFDVARDEVNTHDFHATLLHLLGIDHERFTFPFQGRDFRLTDVSGKVVTKIVT